MSVITVNVNQDDKETFNSICEKMGMNITTAINIFIKAVNRTKSIPFLITLDESKQNEETFVQESNSQLLVAETLNNYKIAH